MTLREKLILVLYKSHSANYTAELLEKQTDKYAIDYANWLYLEGRDVLVFKGLKNTKELLEIFKKEKGL